MGAVCPRPSCGAVAISESCENHSRDLAVDSDDGAQPKISCATWPAAAAKAAAAAAEAEAPRAGERKAISLLDGVSEASGVDVIVSFPGVHQDEWNHVVATARLMQQLDPHKTWISTTCVFLPEGDPELGQHSTDAVTGSGLCFCQKLYGEQKPWGCRWFELWMQRLHLAIDRGQRPIVVYKAGEEGEGDAETWESFPIPFAADRRGLGGSQAAEVAYLRHYLGQLGRDSTFLKTDVDDLADSLSRKSVFSMSMSVRGEEGGKKLAKALRSCPEAQQGLAQLDLPSASLGEVGGAAVAAALPACAALRALDLRLNGLREAGGLALAAALPSCAALEHLALGANSLGEAAGLAIAMALPACRGLRRLELDGNGLGEATGLELAAALPACSELQALDLRDNALGEATGMALAAALPGCRALELLDLNGNELTEAAEEALRRAAPRRLELLL